MKFGRLLKISSALLLLGTGAVTPPGAAAPLQVTTTSAPVEWTVRWGERNLLVYRSDPRQFKPYVKELATFRGDNLLRDAPDDHLHHHGLMYAIQVNGINFWEEHSGSGVQKSVAWSSPELSTNAAGLPQATLRQTLHWVAPHDAFLPASPKLALLIERRTLVLTVDAPLEEVALHWQSQFEVGAKTNTVILGGASYFGLGARFQPELDSSAAHYNSDGTPDLSGTRQDLSPHNWTVVSFERPESPATLALFSHPANRGGNAKFFTMKRPFAYLSATQGLATEPLVYHAGDKFQLDYLVTLYPAIKTRALLEGRAAAWRRREP